MLSAKRSKLNTLTLSIGLAISQAGLAAIDVTDTNDAPVDAMCIDATPGQTSLREAICLANTGTEDTITFNTLAGQTINVAANLPQISKSLTFEGPTTDKVIVDGADASRLFHTTGSGTSHDLTFSNMTIQNGLAPTGGGIYASGNVSVTDCIVNSNAANASSTNGTGGGIRTLQNATIRNSVISENTSGASGGGVFTSLNFFVYDSLITGNYAGTVFEGPRGGGLASLNRTSRNAGGVYNVIENSTITRNSSRWGGGGVYAPLMRVSDSTITYNEALGNEGGGLWSGGGLYSELGTGYQQVSNSTVSYNRSIGFGAGLDGAAIYADHLTVVGNYSEPRPPGGPDPRVGGDGAGLDVDDNFVRDGNGGFTPIAGPTRVTNSVFFDNRVGSEINDFDFSTEFDPDPSDDMGDYTHNFVSEYRPGEDALLGALQNNGGDTETHLLLVGSPLIDGVPNASCPGDPNLLIDQRGAQRPDLPGKNCDIGAVEVEPEVQIIKALDSETGGSMSGIAEPGETLNYTITFSNTGASPMNYAIGEIMETLPEHTRFVSGDFDCSMDQMGPANCGTTSAFTVPGGTMDMPGTTVLNFSVQVVEGIDGTETISNSVVVPGECPDDASNTCRTDTPTPDPADPSVIKSLTDGNGDGIADPGEILTYTITISNDGGVDQTYAAGEIMETVPNSTTHLGGDDFTCDATTADSSCSNTADTTVPAGGSATLSFIVQVDEDIDGSESISNTVVVPGECPDDTSNTCGTDTPTPDPADTSVIKSVMDESGDGIADPGEILTYTITISNAGGLDQTYAAGEIMEAVPNSTTHLGGDDFSCDATTEGSGCSNTIDTTVPAGGSTTLSFIVQVDEDIDGSESISNTVVVPGECPDDTNNTCGTDTPTPDPADTSVIKSVMDESGDGIADPGETLTYTITISNAGGVDQTYAAGEIMETVPNSTTHLGGDDFSCNGTTESSSCSNTSDTVVPAGGSTTLSFIVQVDGVIDGSETISNTVVVPGECPDDTSNTCGTDTPTPDPADTSVIKSVMDESGDGIADPGETLTYTITISNAGGVDQTYPAGEIMETVPNSTTHLGGDDFSCDATTEGSSCSNTADTTVPAGESVALTFIVQVDEDIDGSETISNAVVVQGECPDDTSNTCEVITPVSMPDLVVTKSVVDGNDDGIADPGEVLTYTIRIENRGNGPANDVSVTDAVDDPGITHNDDLQIAGASDMQPNDPAGISDLQSGNLTLDIAAGATATLTYSVTVNDPLDAADPSIDNEAMVTNGEIDVCELVDSVCKTSLLTPTRPEVPIGVPVQVPTLNQWGLLLMMLLMGSIGWFSFGRAVRV